MADQQAAAAPALPAAGTLRNLTDATLTYVGDLSLLIAQAIRYVVRGRLDMRDVVAQMAFIGSNSVPIASLTSFASGAVIALYFAQFLTSYGVSYLVGGVVALALARELVPVVTGVVVAARAGSAIASEIGTMKVTQQIDALRALAVSPIEYLVPPRLVAALVMLPIVCLIGDMAGLLGGYIVSVYLEGVPGHTYPQSIQQYAVPKDFYLGMAKTVFFGLILVTVGCHQGLKTEGGATEVGRATTNAVVISLVLIYIANFFLAWAMFAGPQAI